MKVCIIGAGAIGGLIAARLGAAGEASVGIVARGQTLRALQRHGVRLRSAMQTFEAPVKAVAAPEELGPQDLVVIAVKGPQVGSVAARIGPLLGPDTVVLPALNGVPWWFSGAVPALAGPPLASVDPDGAIAAAIPLARVVGCVVHASASVAEPGVVHHAFGHGLVIGEPRGGVSDRVRRVGALLARAGFETTLATDIRQDVWYKLWGNLTMNPVSAITGATVDRILADPLVREFCSAAMREAARIGAAIGCAVPQSPDDRHAVTAKLGAFRTSMLQDVQARRPIELDGIVGAVREIAVRLGIASPHIDALLGLTRLFGREQGLYADAGSTPFINLGEHP